MSAVEVQIHLKELQVERALASTEGLTANATYMSDLDHEIAVTGRAYIGAAVTEIATLRAELFGPQSAERPGMSTAANFALPIELDYIESTLPRDATILEYRRSRPGRRSRTGWLKQIAGRWARLVA